MVCIFSDYDKKPLLNVKLVVWHEAYPRCADEHSRESHYVGESTGAHERSPACLPRLPQYSTRITQHTSSFNRRRDFSFVVGRIASPGDRKRG